MAQANPFQMNIKELFKRKLSKKELALVTIFEELKRTQAILSLVEEHIIAVARLSLIKPDRLKEESKNSKANAEYLEKMLEVKDETN